MPWLDVAEVMLDPDFADNSAVVLRSLERVNEFGETQQDQISYGIISIITTPSGDLLFRDMDLSRIGSTIFVHTKFELRAGAVGISADIVTWNSNYYTVKEVADYSHFGAGFVKATCELVQVTNQTLESSFRTDQSPLGGIQQVVG